jgi:hypothetical protein
MTTRKQFDTSVRVRLESPSGPNDHHSLHLGREGNEAMHDNLDLEWEPSIGPFFTRIAALWMSLAVAGLAWGGEGRTKPLECHPRLYCTAADLPRLRNARHGGDYARIWKNLQDSADWCLTRKPRIHWIAPVAPDPKYENLYDRFFAIMGDLAVTEHLAFAYAVSGDARYGDAARDWVLASCRVWQREAEGKVDGGKAYAVCRLLKGVATGYDLAYDRFSPLQRQEVADTLIRVGQMYYTDYFCTSAIAGPSFHTHHAVVEWSSFGIAALALLGERAAADSWLKATVKKFEDHLLPMGLAADGSHTEGATFWASTMQYRLFFMDALRRVTGKDLFGPYGKFMKADLALASIAAEKQPGYSQRSETVLLQPSYGQLDYYAPVLLMLAREYRRPIYQYLALWDHSLGCLQRTRYVTPTTKEQLNFSLGGYAYLWYDPSVPSTAQRETRLSYQFPSAGSQTNPALVGEVYLRTSWTPGDLAAGASASQGIVVHAGGSPLLIEALNVWTVPSVPLPKVRLEDNGARAVLYRTDAKGEHSMTLELDRPSRRLVIRRKVPGDWQWWCQKPPTRRGDTLLWGDKTRLRVIAGTIQKCEPTGYFENVSTAYGLLPLATPIPTRFPLIVIGAPADGRLEIEVQMQSGTGSANPSPRGS